MQRRFLTRLCLSAVTIVAAAFLLNGCSGKDGMNGKNGTNGQNATTIINAATLTTDQWASLTPQVKSSDISVTIAGAPVVKFKVTDASGNPIVGLGSTTKSSTALLSSYANINFGIAKLVPGANGSSSKWVNYLVTSTPTVAAPTVTANKPTTDSVGTLVDNGDGTYQYTFYRDITKAKDILAGVTASSAGDPKDLGDVTYEPNLTHRLVITIYGNLRGTGTNTPDATASGSPAVPMKNPKNIIYDFIPATGKAVATTDAERLINNTDNCFSCHFKFDFHGGSRQDTRFCVICHTAQLKYGRTEATTTATGFTGQTNIINGLATGDFPGFIHRIHMGEELQKDYAGSGPYGINVKDVRYPQDQRNCIKCHSNSATTPQGDNWMNVPTRQACGGCHDSVNFITGAGHDGGAQVDDHNCVLCHSAAAIKTYHVPVTPIANAIITSGVASGNTNAAAVAAYQDNLPAGAHQITYDINSVMVDANKHAVVKFKILKDGAAVVFNDKTTKTEIMDNYVGSPSVYVRFAVPQDGITAPVDFNANASGYIKNLWNGTATGTGAGTLSATPDSSGYYTATLTGVVIPSTAKMVTGGIGYTYSLPATTPLTQTDLVSYPYNATTKIGGLIVAAPNVWKVADKFTGRRIIVSDDKCNACHAKLGVFTGEAYHAGQRNNAPTCAFCHNPNQTSSAWSANASTFIHAIHAGPQRETGSSKRSVPFGWHATDASDGFWQIAYPGQLKQCEQCHLPGTYSFSATWTASSSSAKPTVSAFNSALTASMLYTTVGTGTGYAAGALGLSPYVTPGVAYGSGFAFAAATGTTTEAAATTLVTSPIAAACFSCHDTKADMAHIQANGGSIYEARATALGKAEQCLFCHGPGSDADIAVVHSR